MGATVRHSRVQSGECGQSLAPACADETSIVFSEFSEGVCRWSGESRDGSSGGPSRGQILGLARLLARGSVGARLRRRPLLCRAKRMGGARVASAMSAAPHDGGRARPKIDGCAMRCGPTLSRTCASRGWPSFGRRIQQLGRHPRVASRTWPLSASASASGGSAFADNPARPSRPPKARHLDRAHRLTRWMHRETPKRSRAGAITGRVRAWERDRACPAKSAESWTWWRVAPGAFASLQTGCEPPCREGVARSASTMRAHTQQCCSH